MDYSRQPDHAKRQHADRCQEKPGEPRELVHSGDPAPCQESALLRRGAQEAPVPLGQGQGHRCSKQVPERRPRVGKESTRQFNDDDRATSSTQLARGMGQTLDDLYEVTDPHGGRNTQ